MQDPQAQRQSLAHDGQRPLFHFLPPANWMNDPNGVIQWNGEYHLFYQHNPHNPWHERIHWGHAVSHDLVHWQDCPIALRPEAAAHDSDGCWSGCAVDHEGVPTLLYTGVFPQVVCMATSADGLQTWQKHPEPIIFAPPPDITRLTDGHFRDPFVWREGDEWQMLIGCKIEDVGGLLLLYRSPDLLQWEYVHPFLHGDAYSDDPVWLGTMWECPNFLDFGEQQVLILSTQATPSDLLYGVYHIGRYQEYQFDSLQQGILVHGHSFYAPLVMKTENGRYLMWGWLSEERSPDLTKEAGWDGVMSVPIELTLEKDGLHLNPAPELQILRQHHWGIADITSIWGDCLEIIAQFEPNLNEAMGLVLRCSPDGQEQTRLIYQPEQRQIILDRTQSRLNSEVQDSVCVMPISLHDGDVLTVHVLLDRSVIEVFVNGRYCLAGRIYPARPDSLGFQLVNETALHALDVWKMASIW